MLTGLPVDICGLGVPVDHLTEDPHLLLVVWKCDTGMGGIDHLGFYTPEGADNHILWPISILSIFVRKPGLVLHNAGQNTI